MRVAAFQAPLLDAGSMDAIALIEERVRECERLGVSLLCCPEAILGGLADHCDNPSSFAFSSRDELEFALKPLASETVTCIVGYTESTEDAIFYNAAAVVQNGSVTGVYRKHHPAIRRSVYSSGATLPTFRVQDLLFGILICNDSNFPELSEQLVQKKVSLLCIPTNNALPVDRGSGAVAAAARDVDTRLAIAHGVYVMRADVSGRNGSLVSRGSSSIVDPRGHVVSDAAEQRERLLVADVALSS